MSFISCPLTPLNILKKPSLAPPSNDTIIASLCGDW